MELPTSTPYLGLLAELGIWPVQQVLEYKRIMLLHQIVNSKETRLVKQVIMRQIESSWTGCWMEWTEEVYRKYKLNMELITTLSKEKLKSIIKERIHSNLNHKIGEEAKVKTKLRFCSDFKRKQYVNVLGYNEAKSMLKLKLNMTELKSNYKGQKSDQKCNLCKTNNDTTEHLFQCPKIKEKIETPNINIIKSENEQAYYEIANFLKEVLQMKGIDQTKHVAENIGDSWEGI